MERKIIPLNHRWRFALDQENIGIRDGWHKQGLSVYRELSLPHTYNIESGAETYRGAAWYEYHFDYEELFAGKRLRLQCNGIYRDADFWFNGENAGRHYGSGFTTFCIDLPNNACAGKTNVLTVRVQNPFTFDALPQGKHFDWADDGGIFREVALIVTDIDAIDYAQVFAEPALAATNILQHKADAEFSAVVHLCETAGASRNLAIHYTISQITKDDAEIDQPVFKSENYHIAECTEYRLPAVNLKQVSLWHFDRPCLYRLDLFLMRNGEMCDKYAATFGFRKFEVKGTSFVLNGETVRLAGTEWMPGSNPAYGNAEPKEYIYRILTQLKTSNCVFTRFHWQQDESLYDWCDKNGMLVQEEIPSWGRPLPPGEAEMILSKAQADEMIRSHCNHPSIISWGMANELKGQAPETSVFMKELKAYFKKIDPTRLVSYVSHTAWGDPSIDATNVGDMMMVNDYWETWLGPGDTQAELKRVVDGNPGKPLVISETGLCEPANPGGDKRRTGLFRRKMNIYRSIPELSGVINFCLNDYRTQMGEEGIGVLRRRVHGSTDIFGEPKPSYYAVQEECSPVRIISVKANNEKLALEIKCQADIPSYSVEGYYIEYKDIDGKTLRTEQISPLKPGDIAGFEYTGKGISLVCIYRPNGFLALEKEIVPC